MSVHRPQILDKAQNAVAYTGLVAGVGVILVLLMAGMFAPFFIPWALRQLDLYLNKKYAPEPVRPLTWEEKNQIQEIEDKIQNLQSDRRSVMELTHRACSAEKDKEKIWREYRDKQILNLQSERDEILRQQKALSSEEAVKPYNKEADRSFYRASIIIGSILWCVLAWAIFLLSQYGYHGAFNH